MASSDSNIKTVSFDTNNENAAPTETLDEPVSEHSDGSPSPLLDSVPITSVPNVPMPSLPSYIASQTANSNFGLLTTSAPVHMLTSSAGTLEQSMQSEVTHQALPNVPMHPNIGFSPPPGTNINIHPTGFPLPDMPPPYEEYEPRTNAEASNFASEPAGIHPPTYEEVQQQKALEAGLEYPLPLNNESNANGMQVLRISSLGANSQSGDLNDEQLLGTDLMFLAAFTGTFVFNWVALILFLCFCRSIAGRTGALAGFGLSSALAVIFRYPRNLGADRNAWLLWLILVLGLLICIRAILQYAAAKRKFHQLHNNNSAPRLSLVF